jgi:PAS domain S-box-containing protein
MPTLDDLYRGEQSARRVAEEMAARLGRLQTLTAALSQALTTDQVADAIIAHGPALMGATGGTLALRTEDGSEYVLLRSMGSPTVVVGRGQRFPADAPSSIADALREGSPVVVRGPEEWHARYPHLGGLGQLSGDWPQVAAPLAHGQVAGGLCLSFPTGRTFGEEDRAVLLAVAGLCAQALERARLYAAERQARQDSQREVEERRRAEAALRRSEAWFRRIVETAAEGVWVIDAESRTQYVNRRMGDMLGLAAQDMLGRYPSDFLFAEDLEEARSLFRLKRMGDDRPFDFRLRRTDGAAVWCRIANRPLFDDGGQFLGVLGLFSDVTDRKRLEEALSLSERHYRTLADAVPGIVFTSEPNGFCDYCNQRWYDYTGLTEEQTLGEGARSAIHPEDRGRVEARWEEAARAAEPWVCQYRLRNADGGYRWFLGRSVPLKDEGGRVVKWFGISTDIDDEKRLESALKEADRQKNDFLAMLAHELRNPLAPLRNGVYLLKEEVPHSSGAQEILGMMERQITHLVRMVDDLLDVSRISRGKIDLRKGPLELAGVIAQAVETCRPALEARGHQLTVSLPAEPLRLEADPTRLAQALGNLLNNSARYTPEGGHVWITAAREGEEVVVRVRDNGAGLPDELLPTRIFEPLTQAARTLARSEGGLGIGLTLVRTLVELHGGRVEAHSQGPGQGSEFVVRLPAAGQPLPVSSTAGARATGGGPTPCRRILVVEDSRDVAGSLALLLRGKGCEVRIACDGLEGLDAARAFRPDAVLLDIGLPRLDGLQVARRLRQEPGLEGVLLVALSGYGTEEDHRRSREAGCDAHLVKPVDPKVLLGMLAAGRQPATAPAGPRPPDHPP